MCLQKVYLGYIRGVSHLSYHTIFRKINGQHHTQYPEYVPLDDSGVPI
jgi:hypothetical protein